MERFRKGTAIGFWILAFLLWTAGGAGAAVLFSDSFESYNPGTLSQGGWFPLYNAATDTANNGITGSYASDGARSLQLYGNHTTTYAAMEAIPISLPPVFILEFDAMASGDVDSYYVSPYHNLDIGAHLMTTYDAVGGSGVGLIYFGRGGNVYGPALSAGDVGDPIAQNVSRMQWHHVKIRVNREQGVADYWLDGRYVATRAHAALQEQGIQYLDFLSGSGKGWIDNVTVSSDQKAPVWGIELPSGNGPVGGLDNATQVSTDGGTTWKNAFILPTPVGTWEVISGTNWIHCDNTLGSTHPGPTPYRITFDLPAGYQFPRLELLTHVDNFADIYLNGGFVGGYAHYSTATTFTGAPEIFSTDNAALFHPGVNTLDLVAYDQGGYGGIDFKAMVYYETGLVANPGGPYFTGPNHPTLLDGSRSVQTEYPDKWITLWDWDLNNDGYFEISGQTTTKSWASAGDYPVSLRVTDSSGATAIASVVVHVVGDPSAAVSSPADNTVSFYGEEVTFSGATAPNVVSHAWTEGDVTLSSQPTFTKSDLAIGTHVITYRVTDNIGRTTGNTFVVYVRPASERVDLVLEWGDISFWKDGREITNPAPGDAIVIKARVHNLSDGVASGVGVTFSDSYGGNAPSDLGAAVRDNAALPPEGVRELSFPWNVPFQEGYHVIQARVGTDPTETFIANNTATHFLVVGTQMPAGNMSLQTTLSQPQSGFTTDRGQLFTVSGAANYRWANGQTLPLMGGQVSVKILGGQESATVTDGGDTPGQFATSVYAPPSAGTYVLRVTVTDGTLSQSTDLYFTVTQPPLANLTVTNAWFENRVATQPETIRVLVNNPGGQGFTQDFAVNVRVFAPSGVPAYETDATVTGGLAAGGFTYLTLAGLTPADPGYYTITVNVDTGGTVFESNETDNLGSFNALVYPHLADLAGIGIGKSCATISASFRNIGGLASSGGTVEFSDETGMVFATTPYGPLAGKDSWLSVTAPVAYGQTGSHTITARVIDPADANSSNDNVSATYVFENVTDFTVNDLWVNGLRWSNNVAYLNLATRIDAEVQNLGCKLGSGTLEFLVDGVSLGAPITVSNLSGGQAATFSLPAPTVFSSASYAAATNYQLTARVTAGGDTAPGNDTRTESLTISPALPDYQVTADKVSFSFNPYSYQPVREEKFGIFASICNVGQDAGTHFQVAFYEEGREPIGVVQTIDNVTLLPGGTDCYTATPRDAAGNPVQWGTGFSGNHAIVVSVAPVAGVQDDPNDTNNQATRKVWINRPPVASASLPARKAAYLPGESIAFSGAGSNDPDNDPDGNPYAKLGGVVSYTWDFGDNTPLETATTPSISHSYAVPGTYTVRLTVKDNNNDNSAPATVAGGTVAVSHPDLAISSITAPASASSDQSVGVTATVINASAVAAGSSTVSFYLSVDDVMSTSDTFLGSASVGALAAGASQAAGTTVVIPAGTASGSYFIGAIVDAGGLVAESDENDNGRAAANPTAVTRRYPDLSITTVSGTPSTIQAGQSLTATSTVSNGGQESSGNFTLSFYLSSDTTITTSDRLLGSLTLASVAAGGQAPANGTFVVPANLPTGNYYIGAIADPDNQVAESNEGNNSKASGSRVKVTAAATQPDLVILSVSGPVGGTAGQTVAVTATVKNQGTGSAGAFAVGFYLSTDNTILNADTLLGDSTVASLAAGSQATVNAVVTLPANTTAGSYILGAFADRASAVAESSETNNGLAGAAIQVAAASPMPNLSVDNVSISPASGKVGSSVTFTAYVRNSGTAAAGSFVVGFYLSTDSVIATSDKFAGDAAVASLAPGTSVRVTGTFPVPSATANKSYYSGAVADRSAQVSEADEANNSRAGNTFVVTR